MQEQKIIETEQKIIFSDSKVCASLHQVLWVFSTD